MSEQDSGLRTLYQAVTVLAFAFFVITVFQAYMLVRANESMRATFAAQEQPLQEATQVRQHTETLAGRVAQLAADGNVNAKTIVENFRRQGVDMKPPPPKDAAATADKAKPQEDKAAPAAAPAAPEAPK